MSKRWVSGQLAVLVVCALCLALAWLAGDRPATGSAQDGAPLEEPGVLSTDTSLREEITQDCRMMVDTKPLA